jgi:nitrite reductase (NADH) small subunit
LATAVKLGRAADVPEGGARPFEANGRRLAIFRVDGVLHALDGVCPHRGGPLGEATLEGGVATCPWHGWRFDVRTGGCLNVPGRVQARFPVREEDGAILVEI